MRFLSVCSGIEAASVAWNPLGWKAVAFSEIEPFPCAVLAHHYPDTPNWGDMTKYKEWPDVPIDLLCGGTPCQSFSVAGLRKGLDDPRGNLMLTFGAIAAKYRPKWLVWENVPGVLSSNKGRDFGAFLGMLGQLGYGFAYRVLDAQFFGVPQRRRRVFVVGCLGDWRSAAAVLFERHGLSGDPAPSRQARKRIAPTLSARAQGGGGLGTDFDCDGGLVAKCLVRGSGGGQRYDAESETLIAHTLLGKHNSSHAADQDTYITHSLRGEGFDASEDGTGRGTPLVPIGFAQNQRDEVRLMNVAGALAAEPGAKQQTYVAMPHAGGQANGRHQQAVAFQSSQSGVRIDDVHATLDSNNGPRRHNGALLGMQVRRLTPEECEALQAYPRGYTRIAWRGKPPEDCPDGPRYKALGNSWCTTNARWIGERIDRVNSILESAGLPFT
ncbi:DNA cytosine methyltransferase [Achromobacter xylosoxidans]|uniref:DNA cytosine methyltransferase n=1 Tax=Alcaligenes xylosoxydans xylosoxydans TaxID=85698 RepID=UPI0012AA87FC|nr:DNA cytosine methyltransferase [Achromobacter xylosoxidans]CUR82613.1 putative BsuMI modification methylase subunit YdiP [Achromobacter xylosoxidans]